MSLLNENSGNVAQVIVASLSGPGLRQKFAESHSPVLGQETKEGQRDLDSIMSEHQFLRHCF
jgi:hypothetical protein